MTQNQDLRAELLRRFERDQTARQPSGTAGFEAVTRVDGENLRWLKQVIAEIGEPMADYLARMTEHQGSPQPAVLTCPQCGGPVKFAMPAHGQEVRADCSGCGRTIEITASA